MLTKTGRYENLCVTIHESIPDAIRCAERSLGIVPGQKMQPYWGTTRENEGLIVGWKLERKRWRLDYEASVDPSKEREPWGPHINEENFELPKHLAKVVHRIAKPTLGGELKVFLQYKKWTTAGNVDK
jgi:hypothetical protein